MFNSIGYATVVHFAKQNAARIIIACRTTSKGQDAAAKVYKDVPTFRGLVDVFELDQANFSSVIAFADKVKKETSRLDILVLNAGISSWDWNTTKDGWEEVLQVNSLSPGLLALLLLPKLANSKTTPPGAVPMKPHITLVTSKSRFAGR